MTTALQYLQSFNNAAISALTPEQQQMAVDIAYLEVESCIYGKYREIAAANLAAHNLLSQVGSSDASSGGQLLGIVEQQVGDVRVKYGTTSNSSNTTSSSGLGNTIYGQNFLRYQGMVSFSAWNTGLPRDRCL